MNLRELLALIAKDENITLDTPLLIQQGDNSEETSSVEAEVTEDGLLIKECLA